MGVLSQERVTGLVGAAPVVVYTCETGGDFACRSISDNVVSQLGYEPWEFLRNPRFWADHIHPDDAPRLFAELKRLCEQGLQVHEYRFRHKNGGYRRLFAHLQLSRDESGNPVEIVGLWVDITECRRAEDALQKDGQQALESFAELDHLYQTAPVGLCLMDCDLRFVRINERLAAFNGKPVGEHLGRTLREVIPEIGRKVEPLYRRVIESGEPALDIEVHGSTPAAPGVRKSWMASYYPVKSRPGTVQGVSTVVQDITERKRAEKQLQESEERLRRLLESTNALPWEASAETWQFTYVGPQAVKLLGYPLERWYEKDFWTAHIHPEDREYAVNFCMESARTDEHYEFEYRMVASDGRTVWFHDLVSVVSENGAPKRLRGVLVDITERKRVQILQAGYNRVLELLAEGKGLGVVLDELALVTEGQHDRGILCSILLLDGDVVRPVAGPSLPKEYHNAIDGATIGPQAGSCGSAAYRKERVVVTDIMTDALWADYRDLARQFNLRACWSEPILSRSGDVLGTFAMYHSKPYHPNDAEFALLEQAAHLARVAIEHTKAKEALQRSEFNLRQSHKELRDLAGKLLSAQEEEHRRLARELHDDLAQKLAAMAIQVGKLEQQLPCVPEPVREALQKTNDQVVQLAADVHSISRRLHPSILDDLGLVDAIESECGRFSEQEGISVEVVPEDVSEKLPKTVSLCIYRVTQESLRNIAKHSQATKAKVALRGGRDHIALSIQDDGVGFNPKKIRGKTGLGLVSMKERVRLCNGSLSVHSRRGRGTLIEVRIPLSVRFA